MNKQFRPIEQPLNIITVGHSNAAQVCLTKLSPHDSLVKDVNKMAVDDQAPGSSCHRWPDASVTIIRDFVKWITGK